jgi:hypothetical protein
MTHRLERSTLIPKPRPDVFAFFADAHNLERITPEFLHFQILTPGPIAMRRGALIDYQLSLYGMPMRWRTRIEEYVPDEFFTDVQVSGPYRSWRHRHEFEQFPIGTQMRDVVEYEMPLGCLGTLARWLFVRSALESIFDHRNASVREILRDEEG